MATESDVTIFKGNMAKKIQNAPFGADNKLFNLSGSVHYIAQNEIIQANMKK